MPKPRRPEPAPSLFPPATPLLLTVEEAAWTIGVGRSLMYELIADGVIRTVRIGRLRRIHLEDLRTYVDGLRSATPLP